jgi:hypothetical protein
MRSALVTRFPAELRQASRSPLTRIGERLIGELEGISTLAPTGGVGQSVSWPITKPSRAMSRSFRCWGLTGSATAVPVLLILCRFLDAGKNEALGTLS